MPVASNGPTATLTHPLTPSLTHSLPSPSLPRHAASGRSNGSESRPGSSSGRVQGGIGASLTFGDPPQRNSGRKKPAKKKEVDVNDWRNGGTLGGVTSGSHLSSEWKPPIERVEATYRTIESHQSNEWNPPIKQVEATCQTSRYHPPPSPVKRGKPPIKRVEATCQTSGSGCKLQPVLKSVLKAPRCNIWSTLLVSLDFNFKFRPLSWACGPARWPAGKT